MLAVTLVLFTTACSSSSPSADRGSPRGETSPHSSADPSAAASKAAAKARRAELKAERKALREQARAKASAKAKKKAAAEAKASRVIAISVDGLNPTALTQLGASGLPNFFALIRGGASTLNARTELELTETLPNHTGMLTGRPVSGASGHRVDFNTDPGRVTVSSHAGRRIDSVFDVVHATGRTTALYASKTKFALFQRSWSGALDRTVIEEDNDRLVARLTGDLAGTPATFTFLHLSAPDVAGHASGFMSQAYLRAVQLVDRLVGRIRAALSSSPGLRGSSVILTADHGGRGTHGHADAANPEDYRIPFIVDGPTVRPGSDLYALNADYRDPGGARPAYGGRQPVRNGDLADLATRLLGLPPVPGSVFGARDRLDVR